MAADKHGSEWLERLKSLVRPGPETDDPPEYDYWKLARFAGEMIILGLAVAMPLMGRAGFDFVHAYRDATLEGDFSGALMNPWPSVWLYHPFAILPIRWGALLWGVVQAAGFIFALRRFGGNPLWLALSLPCIWTFTQGQVEGFQAWGLALGLTATPWLAGVGLVLLSFKPQFGLPVILAILLLRRDWRLLAAPVVIYGLSLLVWGFWMDDWFRLSVLQKASAQNGPINVGLFPYALILLPLTFRFRDVRIWVLVQSLILPYFAIYAYAPLLTMRWRNRWAIPFFVIVSWVITLLAPSPLAFLPNYQIIAIVPLAVLALEVAAFWRDPDRPGFDTILPKRPVNPQSPA